MILLFYKKCHYIYKRWHLCNVHLPLLQGRSKYKIESRMTDAIVE